MSEKKTIGSRSSPNQTGKSGNDSGSKVKEATGGYDDQGGKHPPNKLFKGPKDDAASKKH